MDRVDRAALDTNSRPDALGRRRTRLRWFGAVGLGVILTFGATKLLRGFAPSGERGPRTQVVRRGDIASRTRVTGRVVPREEVFVRSLVAGVLDELKVQGGDVVRRGDHIATVRIVADPVMLSEAHAQERLAERRLLHSRRELRRVQPVDKSLALSGKDIAVAQDQYDLAKLELRFASERMRLVAHGATVEQGGRSTRVLAPIDGTVLAIPVAVGDMISDTNSYRDGTTVAVMADMQRLLFKGHVEEAHVGKLKPGLEALVRVGALDGQAATGKLTWVAPRATVEQAGTTAPAAIAPLSASNTGVTRFELWVELTGALPAVRSGYSAAAEFTLDERKQVPLIEERALRYDPRGAPFVRVIDRQGQGRDRPVRLGISDGVHIEVLSGLSVGEHIASIEDEP